VLRLLFPADVALIVKVYFDQSLLGQINKEENMFNSWPYVFFYALFGFAAGLFIYLGMLSGSLGGAEAQWNARHGGVSLDLLLSLGVLVLFALKIVVTRFMGFVFDSARLLRRYITILFLAYFNAGIVFLLFAGAMSLMPFEQAPLLFWTGLICIALPFTLRLTYAGYELLSNYRFPKFYLIVYLCTLEIAPVLILIKVLYR